MHCTKAGKRAFKKIKSKQHNWFSVTPEIVIYYWNYFYSSLYFQFEWPSVRVNLHEKTDARQAERLLEQCAATSTSLQGRTFLFLYCCVYFFFHSQTKTKIPTFKRFTESTFFDSFQRLEYFFLEHCRKWAFEKNISETFYLSSGNLKTSPGYEWRDKQDIRFCMQASDSFDPVDTRCQRCNFKKICK